MAHTGKEALLHLMKIFDLLLLPLDDPVLGLVDLRDEGEEHTEEQYNQEDRQK